MPDFSSVALTWLHSVAGDIGPPAGLAGKTSVSGSPCAFLSASQASIAAKANRCTGLSWWSMAGQWRALRFTCCPLLPEFSFSQRINVRTLNACLPLHPSSHQQRMGRAKHRAGLGCRSGHALPGWTDAFRGRRGRVLRWLARSCCCPPAAVDVLWRHDAGACPELRAVGTFFCPPMHCRAYGKLFTAVARTGATSSKGKPMP